MKKTTIFLFLILFSITSYAQTPAGFNYQSVVRDASGNVLANTAIGVQFKLHQTTTSGTVVYTETHRPTTNAYGVFNLVVGQGVTTDDFSTIDWSATNYFLEVSIDVAGGTSYTSMGTTQLLSVPYALHAKYVENGDDLGSHTATKNFQTGGNWISNDGDDEGLLVNSGGRVTTSNKLFLGSNINLDTHWINGDGTDNKGIQFDASGNVNTSAKISVGGNLQINSNWISNDGDNEGIAVKVNGNVGIGESNPQTSLDVVDTAVIGDIAIGSQSTTQNASNQKDEGFTTTPWLYTSAIQAPGERDSAPTMIAVGANNNFGGNDEIHFVTNGSSQVDISNNLLNVSGDIKTSGNIEFNGFITNPSENQIFGTYDDTSKLSNLSQNNVIIGTQAAENATSGGNNVVIGYFAGYNLNGSSNVILGQGAGLSGNAFSNRLYIRDLIYGEFDNDLLQVKGSLEVDNDITSNGEVIIDAGDDNFKAVGATNAVEIISLIIQSDGSLISNVTNSSGITTSRSGHVYKIDFSGHFSSYPAVTITCISTNDTSNRVAQISTLGQNFVEFTVENHNGDSITNAGACITIIGKRK